MLRRVWLCRRSNPFILIVFFGLPFLTRPRAPLLVCDMARVCCIIGDDLLPARVNLRRSFLGWRALLFPAPNSYKHVNRINADSTIMLHVQHFNICLKYGFKLKNAFTNKTCESILTQDIRENSVLTATWQWELQTLKWQHVYKCLPKEGTVPLLQ